MGALISSVFGRLFGDKEVRILILGLDNAGKTTILYRLKEGEVQTTVPTMGFNLETVQYKNIKFQVWDLGGQSSIRPFWRCYYANVDAVIYVVDSSDHARLEDSEQELSMMLAEDELKGVPLLVFANKQDLPQAVDSTQIFETLGLTEIKDRQCSIFQASAVKGTGITEGLDWLAGILSK